MRHLPFFLPAFLIGCASSGFIAPRPAPERTTTEIVASFDRSWDAVIDVFTKRNIPIATIDRTSGLIVASPLTVGAADGMLWADCGSVRTILGEKPLPATRGEFNVLVRANGATTRVRVTVRWSSVSPSFVAAGGEVLPGTNIACETRNVWEQQLETAAQAPPQRRRSRDALVKRARQVRCNLQHANGCESRTVTFAPLPYSA